MKHPIQKIEVDKNGTLRFVRNEIVDLMLNILKEKGVGLNELHVRTRELGIESEDWEQLNQLMGYSVSGAPINEDTRAIAYVGYQSGEIINNNPNVTSEAYYEEMYKSLKQQLKPIVAEMFNKHEDDLD